MAPRTKFTKEQIVEAAFEIARTEGIESITIRKVADKLGSSIAPIYVNFKEASELVEAVIAKTNEVSRQLLMEQQSGNPFEDIGLASIRFARLYPVLFRDLVMKETEHLNHAEQDIDFLVDMMKQDVHLQGLSEGELMTILLKMKIFHIGLCVMVANNQLPKEFGEEQMIQLLNSTAEDVIGAARQRVEGND